MRDERGAGFECLSALPASRARVRFAGSFQGAPVLWDMHLYTLECYRREYEGQGRSGSRGLRPFIDISPGAEDADYCLEVGLNVPLIDEPTIRKAVVMIRNYRRLRLGRHEWGEALAPPR